MRQTATYLLTRINKTPSKYLEEAEPIINANPKIILLRDRNNDRGFLVAWARTTDKHPDFIKMGTGDPRNNLQSKSRKCDADD